MFFTSPDADTLFNDMQTFINAHGEPIPSTAPYAQFKVMELAKRNVVVTLDGQGADEELAGYHYFFGFYFKDLFKSIKWLSLFKELFYYFKIHRSMYGLKTFVYFLLPEFIKTKARVGEKGYLKTEFVNTFSKNNTITGELYNSGSLNDALLDHFEYKLEHLLKWEDRNSMWFSLESRVPFLDYRLVEKTIASTSDIKIKDGMTKHILREAMKGVLSEKIRMRKDKVGFMTPEDEWFRDHKFQKFINELLNSESFRQREIIDVVKAKVLYQKHLNKEIQISKEIWKWINLELWYRTFIN
jgi:asparagine synthase (glutamine-hydrolysing)